MQNTQYDNKMKKTKKSERIRLINEKGSIMALKKKIRLND